MGVVISLGTGAAHGGAEPSVELEHHELVEQRPGGLEICITNHNDPAFTHTEPWDRIRKPALPHKKGISDEHLTFGGGREGVVGHHDLIGGGLDLAPLDLLRLAAARTHAVRKPPTRAQVTDRSVNGMRSGDLGLPEVARHEADAPGLLVLAASTDKFKQKNS